MPSLTHTHTYARLDKERGLYKCAHPQCTHFIDRKLLVGKESVCNSCGTEKFILTWKDLRMAAPKCQNCSNRESAKAFRQRKQMLEEMGIQ